jgi:hypothetical protein
MSILHVEPLENCGDEGFQATTDGSTIFIAVDFCPEESPCSTEFHDLAFLQSLSLQLDRCFLGRLHNCIHYGDIIDVQKDENAIFADMELRIGWYYW